MILLLPAIVLPVLTVYLACDCLFPRAQADGRNEWFGWGLALGLGSGLASLPAWASLNLAGGITPASCAVDLLLWTCAAAGLWRARRRQTLLVRQEASANAPLPANPAWLIASRRATAAFVGIAAVTALASCLATFLSEPLGEWDAWSIWNLRASQLARAGETWPHVFRGDYDHADYPLLLPLANVRLWAFAGRNLPVVPWLTAMLFLAGTILLTAGAVRSLRGGWQGQLAALTLLSSATLLRFAAGQYADVPLSFFVTATLSLWLLAAESDEPRRRLTMWAVSGLTAGCAAWTKNEGLLFAGVCSCVAIAPALVRPAARARLLIFLCGLAPLLAVALDFKWRLAPVNDLVAGQGSAATWSRLADLDRYRVIALGFAGGLYQLGQFLCLALPLCVLALGLTTLPPHRRESVRLAGLVLLMMLAGFVGVYLVTPRDLQWHVNTSVTRLCIQLAPSALLLLFVVLRTPEEAARISAAPVLSRRHAAA